MASPARLCVYGGLAIGIVVIYLGTLLPWKPPLAGAVVLAGGVGLIMGFFIPLFLIGRSPITSREVAMAGTIFSGVSLVAAFGGAMAWIAQQDRDNDLASLSSLLASVRLEASAIDSECHQILHLSSGPDGREELAQRVHPFCGYAREVLHLLPGHAPSALAPSIHGALGVRAPSVPDELNPQGERLTKAVREASYKLDEWQARHELPFSDTRGFVGSLLVIYLLVTGYSLSILGHRR